MCAQTVGNQLLYSMWLSTSVSHMITMPIVYGLWKLLSSTNVRRLSQRVYAGGVERSVADSQSFARKLNREEVKLYG